MMQRFASGVDLSENGQAIDAIAEVGPGNHYLGCAHTQRNFENAFWRSGIADNNSFEQWLAEGSLDAASARSQHLEAPAQRLRGARPRRRQSTSSSRPSSSSANSPCPTAFPE
jgi:trimethylamine:corrinoid methyltransferase-like protein